MIILGLDPGLARTGFGVIDTKQHPSLVRCGLLTTPNTDTLPDRLTSLGQDLTSIIKQAKPDQLVIEDVFFGNNAKTAFLTAQARGVLIYVARLHHIPVNSATPLQVKLQLTGYGQASKQQIQYVVQQRLSLNSPPQPDDTADALALALYSADLRP